ncbi:MAG: hypothetical protein U0165_16410 [Polyangiaceae bacterium]
MTGVEDRCFITPAARRSEHARPSWFSLAARLHTPLLLGGGIGQSTWASTSRCIHRPAFARSSTSESTAGMVPFRRRVLGPLRIGGHYAHRCVLAGVGAAAGMPVWSIIGVLVQSMPNVAVIGGLVHDEGGGSVCELPQVVKAS